VGQTHGNPATAGSLWLIAPRGWPAVRGVVPRNPEGDKTQRAHGVSGTVEAGNVHLPSPEHAPWVREFVQECADFPHGAHDDQVDTMTQALNCYATERDVALSGCFFRTDHAPALKPDTVQKTFSRLRTRLGWTAQGRARRGLGGPRADAVSRHRLR
jgi:hypothetical protein